MSDFILKSHHSTSHAFHLYRFDLSYYISCVVNILTARAQVGRNLMKMDVVFVEQHDLT